MNRMDRIFYYNSFLILYILFIPVNSMCLYIIYPVYPVYPC